MDLEVYQWVILAVVAGVLLFLAISVLTAEWKTFRIWNALLAQGIKAPTSYIPLIGNTGMYMAERNKIETTEVFVKDGQKSTSYRPVVDLLRRWEAELGPVYVTAFGGEARFNAKHPAHLRDVLIRQADVMEKPAIVSRILDPIFMGTGILTFDHAHHRVSRRALNPAFHHQVLKGMVDGIRMIGESMIDMLEKGGHWEPSPENLEADPKAIEARKADGWMHVDIKDAWMSTTLEVIARASFGGLDTNDEDDEDKNASISLAGMISDNMVSIMNDVASLRFFLPFYYNLPIKPVTDLRHRQNTICELAERIIAKRRKQAEQSQKETKDHQPRFMDRILEAEKEAAGDDDDKWVRTQMLTFIFAGHETTSMALSWACFLLCQFPEWQKRAQEEVDEVSGSSSGTFPTNEDLDRLHVIRAIFHEALRLYSPIPVILREASQDCSIGDPGKPIAEGGEIKVPAGTTIIMNSPMIHRDPTRWPAPNAFDPCRFLDDAIVSKLGLKRLSLEKAQSLDNPIPDDIALPYCGKQPPALDFVPFMAGQRNCIGQRLAKLEGEILLSILLRHFDVSITNSGYKHFPDEAVSCRPKYGMPIFLRKRA